MREYCVDFDSPSVRELSFSFAVGEIVDFSEDGSPIHYNTRAHVDRIGGVKVEIFSNEHPPPHFRVKFQNSTANFRISNCELLNGSGEVLKYRKNIHHWWGSHKNELIQHWNQRRPSDCSVGDYREQNS